MTPCSKHAASGLTDQSPRTMMGLYNPQTHEAFHLESPAASVSRPVPLPLGYRHSRLSAMEDPDDFLRKKHNVTQEDVDEALDQATSHAMYQAFGSIVTGKAATGKQHRARLYLKEKEEAEAQRKQSSVMWMLAFSPNDGFMHPVEVKLDSGAEQNFITESLVSRLRLRKKSLAQPQEFISAQDMFTCTSKVQLQWNGRDEAKNETEFFVLPPTSRIEHPLVREDLIETFRSKLFIENPTSSVAYVAAKKMTAEEKAQVEPLREQVAVEQAESSRRKVEYEQRKRKKEPKQDKTGAPLKRVKK
ncbi:unnamed protein product [Discula destructiva]